jgi:hypothetical protein
MQRCQALWPEDYLPLERAFERACADIRWKLRLNELHTATARTAEAGVKGVPPVVVICEAAQFCMVASAVIRLK